MPRRWRAFWGPANTTYGENTGVLALSRVHDPRVIRLAALYAMVLSFSPGLCLPGQYHSAAIIGGVSFILYGMISAIGVRNVVGEPGGLYQQPEPHHRRVILVCGLGFTDGLTFHVGA